MRKLVPETFAIPEKVETEDFTLRTLTINDVVKDYDAVMSSIDRLKGVFGPESSWPSEHLTLEQDLIDLGWHQKEFQNRTSFAYTVMTPDESQCLGCLYIYPADKIGYDAKVILWVRQSEAETGLDAKLFSFTQQWLAKNWCFETVGFPGRTMSWAEWTKLSET